MSIIDISGLVEINGFSVELIIGFEIYIYLVMWMKMFCLCLFVYGVELNMVICLVCLGLLGVLLVINCFVVDYLIQMVLVLNCEIVIFMKWDCKNYYYFDLFKNYQIL